ncbi:biotin--protein ligase [Candidatus Micrarchaeota archaeon]|nr:biotin--protein ligase [Candidatus Micrarchaeota archaeon]
MYYEEKVSGGKLVCFSVETAGGAVKKVRITGDFFLHPEDTIVRIEEALAGLAVDAGEDEAERRIMRAVGNSELIGATPGDFARIFKRAVS